MIDAYVAELGRALRGPRRAKADLLAEARDSLVDAAEAYQCGGLDRATAERWAVADFGGVAEIAPGYQTELGLVQGRRTALLVICFTLVQPTIVWGYAWQWAAEAWAGGAPAAADPSVYALVNRFVKLFGGLTLAAALLAVFACGVGVRYVGARQRLVRAIGVFGLATSAIFAVNGLLLTVLSPDIDSPLSVTGVPWTVAFLILPLVGIGVAARRCLAATAGPGVRRPGEQAAARPR